jgi:hypothetical protein
VKDADLGQSFPVNGGILVNAAFLLVTSALIVGQGGKGEPVPPPAAGKPAPAVAAACAPECCDSGSGHRFRDRLGGLFNRGCNDQCRAKCFDGHRLAAFRKSCDNACKPKIWNWKRDCCVQNRAPATCNDPCNRRGLGILEKLRHSFHRRDNCCDGGCSTAGVAPIRAGEKIEAPKKMPAEAPKGAAPRPNDININNAPPTIAPGTIPLVPSVPSVEVTPAPNTPAAPTTTTNPTVPPVPPVPPPAREGSDSSRAPF